MALKIRLLKHERRNCCWHLWHDSYLVGLSRSGPGDIIFREHFGSFSLQTNQQNNLQSRRRKPDGKEHERKYFIFSTPFDVSIFQCWASECRGYHRAWKSQKESQSSYVLSNVRLSWLTKFLSLTSILWVKRSQVWDLPSGELEMWDLVRALPVKDNVQWTL